MRPLIRLILVFAGAFILSGCEPAADIVFDISKATPLRDGRPVIDIKTNGRPRPMGSGYNGSYLIVVRRNGVAYYVRWFYEKEAEEGTQRDLAIPNHELKPGDKFTVAIENFHQKDPSNYVRLSNVLEVQPPPPSAPSFAIPNPTVAR